MKGGVYIPISDYRGSIRKLIDPYAQVAQAFDYTAFGEETTSIAKPYNPWRYAAKRFDTELELSYFGRRYYDANLGRWITTDPAGFMDGTNLYAYLHNDPLSYYDPNGEFALPLFTWAIGGAAACPLTWGLIASVGVGYAACWAVQKMIDHRSIQSGTVSYTVVTGVAGTLANSMINNSLQGNLALITSSAITSNALCGDQLEFTYTARKKEGSVDPSLPADPDEILKRPGWRETTHPDAGKRGHRTFENGNTGEQIRHDEGKRGEPGHKGHDHFHHLRPDGKGKLNYLDGSGKIVPERSEESHLYAPRKVWWNKS